MDDNQYRQELYKNTRDDLLKRQLSNSERLDNAILTLSTGALGLSLAFIKDIVPIKIAIYLWLLKTSWWLFGVSIVITLCSFVVSQLGINIQLKYAEEYYLNKKNEYLTKRNRFAKATDVLNYSSCAIFIMAIICTIIFVSLNIGGKNGR